MTIGQGGAYWDYRAGGAYCDSGSGVDIVTLNINTAAGTTVQVERRPFAASTAASMSVLQVLSCTMYCS